MYSIAKFEKVSYEQFKKDWIKTFDNGSPHNEEYLEPYIRNIYDNIKLPQRATEFSAGYDIFCPSTFEVYHNDVINIPTGIRCKINKDWVLLAFPRSGQGFKYGVHLANTVGVIDSDYYNAENEGHIFVKLVNDSVLTKNDSLGSKNHLTITSGQAFCQGIFLPYGVTIDDEATGKRTGGFGSTG